MARETRKRTERSISKRETTPSDRAATPSDRTDRAEEPDQDGEAALVEAVKGGDMDAFSSFVARYTDPGYAVALSILRHEHDAEDAVQAAFVRALERIGQLRPGSRFGPWFYRVLRSTCLNLRRRERLRAHPELREVAAAGDDPHRALERSHARQRVLDTLAKLPERQRTAVVMYDLEGYDHAEIAEILGIAEGTSRANLHHGRRALRRMIGERDDLEDDRNRHRRR